MPHATKPHPSTIALRHLRRTIGRDIHNARVQQRMTLERLSRLTGISVCVLDMVELGKGQVGLDELVKVLWALG